MILLNDHLDTLPDLLQYIGEVARDLAVGHVNRRHTAIIADSGLGLLSGLDMARRKFLQKTQRSSFFLRRSRRFPGHLE